MAAVPMAKKPRPYLGGCASMLAAVCSHPMDTVKVRLQVERIPAGVGVLSVARHVVRAEGLWALYRGLSASLMMQASYSMVRFAAYGHMKSMFPVQVGQSHGLGQNMVMAAAAGALGGLAGNPTDVVAVRMQGDGRLPVAQRRHYRHVVDGLVRIAREEGVGRLYRGAVPNIQRAMVVTTGQLASYDHFKVLFGGNIVAAAFCSSIVTVAIAQPVDVVKTNMMSSFGSGGAWACARHIVRTRGVAGLYAGFIPGCARLGPHTLLTLLFFEYLQKLFPS